MEDSSYKMHCIGLEESRLEFGTPSCKLFPFSYLFLQVQFNLTKCKALIHHMIKVERDTPHQIHILLIIWLQVRF